MKMKFTPPPWYAHGGCVHTMHATYSVSYPVVNGAPEHLITSEELEANAQLIAYAPDLFLMVEKLIDAYTTPAMKLPDVILEAYNLLRKVDGAK